uniref:Major facilitator superfamily domain containing 4B n=1 Tax=Anolis carolinensis TaxID=28377 RepID=A0A803TIQ1_ANOCA
LLCHAVFASQGMAIAVLGPTFPDLAANVNRNVSQISFIIAGRSSGYLGGSLIGGLLVDCMNSQIILRGNVMALDTWGAEAGPHLQALHFSFALGGFVTPTLDKMVLGGSALDPQDHPGGTGDHQPTVDSPVSSEQLHFTMNVMLSYIVIGTFVLLVALFFCLLYWKSSSARDRRKFSAQKYKFAKYHYALIILLSVFFFWYVGAEVAYAAYIFTYARTHVGMKESEAAGLNSVFWGSFAACRGLAICLAACSHPGSIILLSIILASVAAIFPSGISWVEQYTTIQGKSAAVFVVGAAMGQMCIPALVGFLQGHYPAVPVLMYTVLVSTAMMAMLFPVLYKLATSPSDPKWKGAGDGNLQEALLSNSHLEEEDEDDKEGKEWNEADFEVIEMNDTRQNSVIKTSTNIQGESTLATSTHPPSRKICNPPVVSIGSPRQKTSSKNDYSSLLEQEVLVCRNAVEMGSLVKPS